MKPLIALIATASLPFAAQAQAQTMAPETRTAATAAVSSSTSSSSSTCSISSEGGFSSLDYSWGASNSSSSASAMGRNKSDGWNLATGKPGIADEGLRLAWTPSSSGGAPTVVAHAINTKGTGGTNGRQASSGTACDTATIRADAGKSPTDLACRINPGRSVTIFNPPPPPMLDKASFQDFHFTISSHRSAGAGAGGGPHVKSIVCSGPDGSPTSVSMLLLLAVQK